MAYEIPRQLSPPREKSVISLDSQHRLRALLLALCANKGPALPIIYRSANIDERDGMRDRRQSILQPVYPLCLASITVTTISHNVLRLY